MANRANLNIDEAPPEAISIHWNAIFAGLFVSVIAYAILMSLGMAMGRGLFDFRAISQSVGIWTAGSLLISLFLGSYAAGRVSGIIATRIGYIQGVVIAALFFLLMGLEVALVLRVSGRVLSGTAVAESPGVFASVDDVISDLDFRRQPNAVVGGVIDRLLRDDTDSASTFLANESGISRADAELRVQTIKQRFDLEVAGITAQASSAARLFGWSAFIISILGTGAAMLGGASGAQINLLKPVDRADRRALRRHRAVYV